MIATEQSTKMSLFLSNQPNQFERSLISSSYCLSKTGKKTDLEQKAQMRKNNSPAGKQMIKNWYLTLEVLQK